MSKYAKHKHGITVGSDNVFFVAKGQENVDPGEIRDGYKAILWAENYEFDMINTMSVFVMTPAQQIMWMRVGGGAPFGYSLRRYWWDWLANNVGKYREDWDVMVNVDKASSPIFFKRVKDANSFAKEVDRILKGVKL